MALKHAKALTQADGGDTSVVLPSDWNSDHVVDSGGILMTAGSTDPLPPAAGKLTFYSRLVAGRAVPKVIGPSGTSTILQNFLGQDKVSMWSPPGNATTVSTLTGGATAFTTVGTATARNVATTNFATRIKRLGYVSSTTAGSLVSLRVPVAQYTLGVPGSGVPDMGGFFLCIRFMTSDAATVSGARQFVGISSATGAPTNVEPSTLTNSIGVGHGASDTNLKIFYGGSAAQTPIDLGANFPANTLSVDVYELILFASPKANNAVGYKVTRLNTGHVAEGTLTAATPGTQLPSNTTLLTAPLLWRTNNATASAVGLDFISAWISTDQ
jgi:hypothetical protein